MACVLLASPRSQSRWCSAGLDWSKECTWAPRVPGLRTLRAAAQGCPCSACRPRLQASRALQVLAIYFAGAVCLDEDTDQVYLMASDCRADSPCAPGLSLGSIASLYTASQDVVILVDAACQYVLRGQRAVLRPGPLSLVAHGGHVVTQAPAARGMGRLAGALHRVLQAHAAAPVTVKEVVQASGLEARPPPGLSGGAAPKKRRGSQARPRDSAEIVLGEGGGRQARSRTKCTFELECLLRGPEDSGAMRDLMPELQAVATGEPLQVCLAAAVRCSVV